MNKEIHENVLQELECISDRCITGDVTVAVFDILKKTSDLEGLCKALGVPLHKPVKEVKKFGSLFDQLLNSGIQLE